MNIWRILLSSILVTGVLGSCASLQPPPEVSRAAVTELMASLDESSKELLAGLDEKERADLLNALAWVDERPGELVLVRDGRGSIRRLTAPLLAYDFARGIEPGAGRRRAEHFFDRRGFGRRLLGLGPAVGLRFDRELLAPSGSRYRFRQLHAGRRVFGAEAVVALDDEGRLTGLGASLVPDPDPEIGVSIGEDEAATLAIEDLRRRDAPFWVGIEPVVERIEKVVFDLFPSRGEDRVRLAYNVVLVAADRGSGGYREVIVDELTGEVLASIERARLMLDGRDRIVEVDGAIDCTSAFRTVATRWTGAPGGTPCPDPADPIRGPGVLDRDEDEVRAAMCAAVDFFAERGGELGSTDFRRWIDPPADGLVVQIGATPSLSIGVNNLATITVAAGAGRAEVIGHELAHSMVKESSALAFNGTGPDGGGIEEHVADLLGLLLERRLSARGENRCLQGDDTDTLDTIGRAANPDVPCRGMRLPWRSLCRPGDDNGGWCEGARTFLDNASNLYDVGFPAPTLRCSRRHFPLTHTNLGIGNRAAAALFEPAGTGSVRDGFRIEGVGQETAERLFLAASTALPTAAAWADWGQAWIDAARAVSVTVLGSPLERNVRSALASAAVWSLPRSVTVDGAAGPETLDEVTRATRPAVASLLLADGRERTYVFYRDNDFGDALSYVWRDEVSGGSFAEESSVAYAGPCRLAGARTRESPAVVGRTGRMWVAWSEPADEEDVGVVRGARLLAENAADAGCADGWEEMPPGLRGSEPGDGTEPVERRLRGGPALAVWRARFSSVPGDVPPPEEMVRCFPDPRVQIPGNWPRYPIGPLPAGFGLDRCLFGGPQEVPLPPTFTRALDEFLRPLVADRPVRALPAVYDLLAPARDLEVDELEHEFSLDTRFRLEPELREELERVLDLMGDEPRMRRFAASLTGDAAAGAGPSMAGAARTPFFQVKYFLPGGFGLPGVVMVPPSEERLVLAFRDPQDRIRIVEYDDPTPTDRDGRPAIAVLARDVNPIDPVLASLRFGAAQDYLVAIYGVRNNELPTGLAYRTLTRLDAAGVFDAGLFTPPARIDELRGRRGVRRQVEYAYGRTRDTPAAVADGRHLHLFAVELEHPAPAAGDPTDRDYDPFPGSSSRRMERFDRVRYALLLMDRDGRLRPVGERPVRLSETAIISMPPRIRSGRTAQVGAAQMLQRRRLLRFYLPTGAELAVKTRVVR